MKVIADEKTGEPCHEVVVKTASKKVKMEVVFDRQGEVIEDEQESAKDNDCQQTLSATA